MTKTLLGALVMLTFLAYAPVRGAGWVYEDDTYQVPAARAITAQEVFAPRGLTAVSFRIQYLLQGADPRGYHGINLFLHVLVGLGVFAVARLLLRVEYAMLAAGLHLLHPLNTEAVAYVAGRGELIAAFGALVTLWALMQPVVTWKHVGLALVGLIIGVGGKEVGIMALPIAALHMAIIRKPAWSWRLAGICAGGVGAAALFAIPILGVRILGNLYFSATERGALAYASLQSWATWTMLRLAIVPWGQSVDHDYETATRGMSIMALLALVTLAAWAWRRRQTMPVVTFGVLWMLVALSPRFVIRISEYVNEHQVYLPFIGLWLALASGTMYFHDYYVSRAPREVPCVESA